MLKMCIKLFLVVVVVLSGFIQPSLSYGVGKGCKQKESDLARMDHVRSDRSSWNRGDPKA